jgi:hypothetical protein
VKSKRSRRKSPIHLHVVVHETLRAKLEDHARKLHGNSRTADRPNLSAAVRDLLCKSLGLPSQFDAA